MHRHINIHSILAITISISIPRITSIGKQHLKYIYFLGWFFLKFNFWHQFVLVPAEKPNQTNQMKELYFAKWMQKQCIPFEFHQDRWKIFIKKKVKWRKEIRNGHMKLLIIWLNWQWLKTVKKYIINASTLNWKKK